MHLPLLFDQVWFGCCTESGIYPNNFGNTCDFNSLFLTFSRGVWASEALETKEGLGILGDEFKVNKTDSKLHVFERPWLGRPGQSSSATTTPLCSLSGVLIGI